MVEGNSKEVENNTFHRSWMRKTGLSGLMLINLSFAKCSRATKLYTEVDGYLKGWHVQLQDIVLPNSEDMPNCNK